MLTVYAFDNNRLVHHELQPGAPLPTSVVWLDLFNPTTEEKLWVDEALGIDTPTREEMQEIEASSRLYREDDNVVMTAIVLARTDSDEPQSAAVTFMLSAGCLITLRYSEPRPFRIFAARAQRHQSPLGRAELVLVGLLEAIVDRAADILERIGSEVDGLSRDVFNPNDDEDRDFQRALRRTGRVGDLNSNVRESLVSIGRMLTFFNQVLVSSKGNKDIRVRLKTLSRDVHSLTDHASFLSGKINFLLDATLGMINIEQNNIIKIFSVMAVVFLPPTLIASIYGMNFVVIPELHWAFGYPLALVMMVVSAIMPYLYFKRRGWL